MNKAVNKRIALISTIHRSRQKGLLTPPHWTGPVGRAVPSGPSPGTQDHGFPCPRDLELIPRPARVSSPSVFSQGPSVLLVCLPLTSESGQVAGVCGNGGVCAWNVTCGLGCPCVCTQGLGGRQGDVACRPGWLPMTPGPGSFLVRNETVYEGRRIEQDS